MMGKLQTEDFDIFRFRKLEDTTRFHGLQLFSLSMGNPSLVLNELTVAPMFIPKTMKFNRMAINVTVLATGGKARFGVYADNGTIYPGRLLVDSGEVDTSTTGVKEVTLSPPLVLVKDSVVWQGGVAGVATCSVRGGALGNLIKEYLGIDSALGTAWVVAFRKSYTYNPLPDPYPAGAVYSTANIGYVFFRKV